MTVVVVVLVVALVAGLVGVVLLTGRRVKQRTVPVDWQRAAVELGLHYRLRTERNEARMTGQRSGMMVRIERVERDHVPFTEIAVVLDRRAPGDARFAPVSFWSRAVDDVVIGDPAFDEVVHIEGNPVWVQAVLDASTREMLARLVRDHGVTLRRRELVWAERGLVRKASVLVERVEALEALAERLCKTKHMMRGALATIAHRDPVSAVRISALQVLMEHYPRSPETKQALRQAINDPELDAQRLALEALPDTAHRRLERIAFGEVGERLHAQVQAQAFERLLATCDTTDDRLGLLVRALGARAPVLWRIGSRATSALVASQGSLCGVESLLAELLARNLAALSPVKRADDDVEVAVIEALGLVGGLELVPVLMERSTGLLVSTPVKQAARAAVTAIQTRCGTVTDGALSLASAGDEAGAVSLVDER